MKTCTKKKKKITEKRTQECKSRKVAKVKCTNGQSKFLAFFSIQHLVISQHHYHFSYAPIAQCFYLLLLLLIFWCVFLKLSIFLCGLSLWGCLLAHLITYFMYDKNKAKQVLSVCVCVFRVFRVSYIISVYINQLQSKRITNNIETSKDRNTEKENHPNLLENTKQGLQTLFRP